ncbi:MAG: tRNA (adenosine(37)-N6)-threonylcarbamoyltransferase complex dimerization subunit type 1 TsaB [Chloroflexota bacterium]
MIVALESASSDPSLALAELDGSAIAVDGWTGEGRQSSELLPHLLVLLARSGRELREATAVAVGIGPGSFTGLRVSMSLAKGISLAFGVPLVGIPSLEAWLAAEPAAVAAVARAGAQESYLLQRDEQEPRVVSSAELPQMLGGSTVVVASELALAFGLARARSPERAAAAIASMAAARLAEAPDGDDLERLEPHYIRAPRGIGTASEVGQAPNEVRGWP